MTPKQIAYYRKAAEEGSIPDDQNPLFLFSVTHTDLLVKMLKMDFDVLILARNELALRGLNEQGKYMGFSVKPQPKRKKQFRKSSSNSL